MTGTEEELLAELHHELWKTREEAKNLRTVLALVLQECGGSAVVRDGTILDFDSANTELRARYDFEHQETIWSVNSGLTSRRIG